MKLFCFLQLYAFILGSTVIHFNDGVAINGVVKKMLYLLGTWFACKSMSYKEYKYCYEKFDCITLCGGYNNSDAMYIRWITISLD